MGFCREILDATLLRLRAHSAPYQKITRMPFCMHHFEIVYARRTLP